MNIPKEIKNIKTILRELNELIRGLVSDLQDSNSLSKATIKCYEGKLIKNLEKLDSLKKEEIIGCSTCKFNLDGSFVCETCDTGFTNYEPIDSEKKEHIASLNDPKAFEVVNLGVLKRERKDSGDKTEKKEKKEYKEGKFNLYSWSKDYDLGTITSKNGELSAYIPSQFIKDYAKEHSSFSLIGLLFPKYDSGGEKEPKYSKCEYFELKKPIDKRELDMYYCGHEENMESECEYASCPLGYSINTFKDSGGGKGKRLVAGSENKEQVRGVDNVSTLHPKRPEFICSLKEQNDCDEEGSMDCLKGNSEGFKALREVCVHGKKELEYLPELDTLGDIFAEMAPKEAEPENKDKLEGALD